jgi:hypothetical protein
MKVNEIMVYDGCPELERIAQVRANLAAIRKNRKNRGQIPVIANIPLTTRYPSAGSIRGLPSLPRRT